MAVAVESAERLRDEALRLDGEVREHRHQLKRHRRLAREKAERRDALRRQCAAHGIVVVFEPTTQPIGGHSDHKSTSST